MTLKLKPLLEIGKWLQARDYRFVTVTPESHQRILARPRTSRTEEEILRDLFGWSRSLPRPEVPPAALAGLEEAGALQETPEGVKSLVRFSTLDDLIFAHSAYPTKDENSVFFGPDSYRFVRFLKEKSLPMSQVFDLGCGSGVGGMALVAHWKKQNPSHRAKLVLSDINPLALDFCRLNAALNEVQDVEIRPGSYLDAAPPDTELVIANPPFIIDEEERAYRHGGTLKGAEFSLKIVEAFRERLRPGARLLLYTGASVVKGKDVFKAHLEPLRSGFSEFTYEEIDPDIFGEELSSPAYADVDRIAAVGLSLRTKG